MRDIAYLITVILWIAGWVLAQGFWTLFFAVVFPPFSIYLVVEKVMLAQGWVY